MPRFVVLAHDHPFLHWDLLLEQGGSARTWRLLAEPQAGQLIPAEPLPDHRLMYLDYEGPVSGGRGCVQRWDAGQYDPQSDVTAGVEDRIEVRLTGERLRGSAVLQRTGDYWTFCLAVR